MRSLSRHVMQAKSRLAWVFFIISGEFNFLPTCTDLLTKVFWNQSVDVFKRSHANDEGKHSSRSTVQIENEAFGGVFLSVNPKTDFRSKNGFRVPFGKSKSVFLIWWILFEKGFIGFEIRRIHIQINGLVIYAVPFTVDAKLVRWSSGISSWGIPIEAVEFPRCCHLSQNIWKH